MSLNRRSFLGGVAAGVGALALPAIGRPAIGVTNKVEYPHIYSRAHQAAEYMIHWMGKELEGIECHPFNPNSMHDIRNGDSHWYSCRLSELENTDLAGFLKNVGIVMAGHMGRRARAECAKGHLLFMPPKHTRFVEDVACEGRVTSQDGLLLDFQIRHPFPEYDGQKTLLFGIRPLAI